jgi:hypothetical protein
VLSLVLVLVAIALPVRARRVPSSKPRSDPELIRIYVSDLKLSRADDIFPVVVECYIPEDSPLSGRSVEFVPRYRALTSTVESELEKKLAPSKRPEVDLYLTYDNTPDPVSPDASVPTFDDDFIEALTVRLKPGSNFIASGIPTGAISPGKVKLRAILLVDGKVSASSKPLTIDAILGGPLPYFLGGPRPTTLPG